jgi:glutathione S-transferase
MAELEIIGMAQSIFVRTVRMALEEKGVAYRHNCVMPQTPDVLALNPFGRVPAMRHGAVTLFESRAIVGYADRVFDGPKLFPEAPGPAAVIEQWIGAINGNVMRPLFPYMQAHAFPKGPNGTPDRAVVDAAWPGVKPMLAVLDEAVAAGALAGPRFTVADMFLMPALAYLPHFAESRAFLDESRNLKRYFEAHAARPCFVKTTPPPMSELRN